MFIVDGDRTRAIGARSNELEVIRHQGAGVDVPERQDVGAVEGDDGVGPGLADERLQGDEVRQPEPAQVSDIVVAAFEAGDRVLPGTGFEIRRNCSSVLPLPPFGRCRCRR